MALHGVNARCCRWLLMTHDRVGRDQFEISHEFLAMMLGSTRPTVTTVAGALQKARLIRDVHGRVTILNRPGLERASCECYLTVKEHFDRPACSGPPTSGSPDHHCPEWDPDRLDLAAEGDRQSVLEELDLVLHERSRSQPAGYLCVAGQPFTAARPG